MTIDSVVDRSVTGGSNVFAVRLRVDLALVDDERVHHGVLPSPSEKTGKWVS
ncbi:hypothetical protein ACFXGT_14725 [Streptomyces sp. NPDC059352]|uniref:hypothetical protein n=1 Tax=Streptomyces sp. NPDC059352 TaxID=3346810 RepID=UPI0036C51677